MTLGTDAAGWRDRGRSFMLAAIVLTIVPSIATAVFWSAVPTLAIPVLASLLPLLAKSRKNIQTLRVVASLLIFVFAALGAASVGFFYIPAAVVMTIAAVRLDAEGPQSATRAEAPSTDPSSPPG